MSKLSQYKIFFYKSATGTEIVINFIDLLSDKNILKIRSEILLLEEYGLSLMSTSKVKKLTGFSNLYELRIKAGVQIRLFFAFVSPHSFLILHGFIKKTNKTSQQEIKTAVNRLKEFDI